MRIATQQLLEKIVKERTLQELTMEYSNNVVTVSLMFLSSFVELRIKHCQTCANTEDSNTVI